MRKPIVAGNWKMNKTATEARSLIEELIPMINHISQVEKVLCPTFLAIPQAAELLKGSEVGLGAQNLHWEKEGAFTGEVSPEMVAEFCAYVIIGHSERRTYFGETDETVNKKAHAAFRGGLIPIVCVGETLEENQAGRTEEVVTRQVKAALAGLSSEQVKTLIVAYEPVWAIGTGLPATAEGANQVIADYIRKPIGDLYDQGTAEAVRIQYGGSVKANNALEYFSQPDIDGALVGGASLKAAEFTAIVAAAAESVQ